MPEVSCTNNAHELSMATFMTDAQKRRAERVAEAMAKKVKTTPSTPKTLATAVIKITQIPEELLLFNIAPVEKSSVPTAMKKLAVEVYTQDDAR